MGSFSLPDFTVDFGISPNLPSRRRSGLRVIPPVGNFAPPWRTYRAIIPISA